MFYLVGSRAIGFYLTLPRPVKDWDLWYNPQAKTIDHNSIIQGELVDFHAMDEEELSLVGELSEDLPTVMTPVGLAKVTPLWFNLLLKASHYSLNKKIKHLKDYELLRSQNIALPKNYAQLLHRRFIKTQARQADFFDPQLPRYFPHDLLHLYVAQAQGLALPQFSYLLPGEEYLVAEEKFLALPEELKGQLALEEALVLGLERWFIKQIVESPGSLIERWELFCSAHSPAVEYLERLGVRGRIKDHPDYLADWIFNNYAFLQEKLQLAIIHLKYNMPEGFWETLKSIRYGKK